MVDAPINVLRDIIKTRLDLGEDRVNIYNDKFNIPKDNELFITLEYVNSKVISSRATQQVNVEGLNGYVEVQDLNTQEVYDIDIMSRNTSALLRKEEVVMALTSQYSQQMQDACSFKIFRITPLRNLSSLEVSANLYRFMITVTVLAHYQVNSLVDYYNTFGIALKAEGTPLIKKDIDQPITEVGI